MDDDDQERTRPLPGMGQGPHERIADQVLVEVVGASINGQASASLTFRVSGRFARPGSVATLEPTAIVVSVPAAILPR